MSKYQVHLSLTYEVEADTEDDAEAKAYERFEADYGKATLGEDLFECEVQPAVS